MTAAQNHRLSPTPNNATPSSPRLVLAPERAGRAVLDGGWWPTTYGGDQIDLLVVPPSTATDPAKNAMAQAADPANLTRAHTILTANPTARPPVSTEDSDEQAGWDDEGGRTAVQSGQPRRPR